MFKRKKYANSCPKLKCDKKYKKVGDYTKPEKFVSKKGKIVNQDKHGKCKAEKKY